MKPLMPAVIFAAAAALATGSAAQDGAFQPKAAGTFMINARASMVAPDAGDPITTLGGAATGLSAEVDADVMPTLGFTYFLTDHVAVEAIAGTTRHTITAEGAGAPIEVKTTWVLPPVVTVQYHFAPAERFSPYVGAGVNYMLFYGEDDLNGFHVDIDNGFGAALQAGADVALNGPWSFNVDVKKVWFSTDAVDTAAGLKADVHLDPWVVSAGFGRKF